MTIGNVICTSVEPSVSDDLPEDKVKYPEVKVKAKYPEDKVKYPEPRFEQMWARNGDSFSACEKATQTLEPGQYNIHSTEYGIIFKKHEIQTDKLINLPDSASEEIIIGIEKFWNKKEHFETLNFLHKRGILLWGAPGSGKTSTIQQISKLIISKGGISFYVDDPGLGAAGLAVFRKIEPDRPILVMLEDLDAIIERFNESSLLALLDGELQINNVVFVASTNYPEQIDARILNRPSRFDVIKHIGMPNSSARRIYLSTVNKRLTENTDELECWVDKTKGFSIAHMKEVVVGVEVFENNIDNVIKRLKNMMNNKISSSDRDTESDGFGFSP